MKSFFLSPKPAFQTHVSLTDRVSAEFESYRSFLSVRREGRVAEDPETGDTYYWCQ